MPSLRKLQCSFGAVLLDPARASILRGMSVYRGNVYGNWSRALAAAYPIVRKIVGTEFFDGVAHEFAHARPSQNADLNDYGARLPEFLATFRHTQDLPYLPDVARMEWLAHRAYYAADAAPLDLESLLAVDPEHYPALRPALSPGCALLASAWPLAKLWAIHQDGYDGALTLDLTPGAERILIHRPRWRAEVRSLTRGEYACLEAAIGGMTLGAAIDAALLAEPAFDPSWTLPRWAKAGILARLDPP